MEAVHDDLWKTFMKKAEQLFIFGYKLPLKLQVKAVTEVNNKLASWKKTLSHNSETDTSGCDTRTSANDALTSGHDSCHVSLEGGSREAVSGEVKYLANGGRGLGDTKSVNAKHGHNKKFRRRRRVKSRLLKNNYDKSSDCDKPLLCDDSCTDSCVLEETFSHSEEEGDSKSVNVDSSHKNDAEDGNIRRSKRIKIKRDIRSASDEEANCEKVSFIKQMKEEEVVVKLEAMEQDNWNGEEESVEALKPITPGRRARGRPRKIQSLPESVFERLSLTYKCSKCSKSYGTEEVLNCHMEAHKDKMPLTCLTCHKTYNSKGGFDNHIRTHDPENQIQCPQCEFRYPNYTVMNRHVLVKHASINSRPFLCDLCGKRFLQPSTLKVHMSTHDAEKNFACDQCEFRTHTKNILNVHKKNMHSQKEYYSCDLCGAQVKYRGSLIEHRRRHFGEKPHQCSICSSRFTSRSQLAQHMRIHKEKTFVCNQCNKKFINKHKLARHMTIHTGEKSYACGFCNYQCNVRGNIRKHWLFVHKIDHDRRMQRVKLIKANDVQNSSSVTDKASDTSPAMKSDHTSNVVISSVSDQEDVTDSQQVVEIGLASVAEISSGGVESGKHQANYSSATSVLPEITTQVESFPASISVLPTQADLTSVLSETNLTVNDVMNGVEHCTATVNGAVVHSGKVLELPMANSNMHQDPIGEGGLSQNTVYPSDMGLETKIEMAEDGTQYVYVYFPLTSESAVPSATTEEYVVTGEDSEIQQTALSIQNVM